jgi:hypothetical protein
MVFLKKKKGLKTLTVVLLFVLCFTAMNYVLLGSYIALRNENPDYEFSYGLDDRGFEFRRRLGIFSFTTASRPAPRPT